MIEKHYNSQGIFSYLTIATVAAGRGMNIKLDKKSLEISIIPYQMENEKVSGNVYEDMDDRVNLVHVLNIFQIKIFIMQKNFNPNFENPQKNKKSILKTN